MLMVRIILLIIGIANHYRPQGNEIVARKLAQALPRLVAPTCG